MIFAFGAEIEVLVERFKRVGGCPCVAKKVYVEKGKKTRMSGKGTSRPFADR